MAYKPTTWNQGFWKNYSVTLNSKENKLCSKQASHTTQKSKC